MDQVDQRDGCLLKMPQTKANSTSMSDISLNTQDCRIGANSLEVSERERKEEKKLFLLFGS